MSELLLETDLRCTHCGYSLHSLDVAALCPECGRAVADSIAEIERREARFGPPLLKHSAAWLRAAAWGFLLFLLGAWLRLLVDRLFRPPAYWPLLAVSSVIVALGVLLWTIPPMNAKPLAEVLRWLTRVSVSIWCILDAGFAVSHFPEPHGRFIRAALYVLMWSAAVASVAGLLYLSELAGRMRRMLVRNIFLLLTVASLLIPIGLAIGGLNRPR
ncbi:MAG TPA: hypothetical protein VL282_04970, partial [Tepidisphaeraceae bacterium]|nr:hypothetical protein [Tepidisphaeraceae bacterium]